MSKWTNRIANKVKRVVPSGFNFSICDRIEFVNENHWDEIAKSSTFFLSRSYLQALQANIPDAVQCRFVICYEGNLPIFIMLAQILNVSGDGLGKLRIVKGLEERAVICGNMFTWGQHGIAIKQGYQLEHLWPAVVEVLYRIRRSEKISGQIDYAIFKEVESDRNDERYAPLREFGYRPLVTEPGMYFDVPSSWTSYDNYLESLQSKNRSSIKKIFKEIEEGGFKIEKVDSIDDIQDELYGLYMQVAHGNKYKPVSCSRGYLASVAKAAGKNFRCTIMRNQSDQIVGFITSIKEGDLSYGYHIGYDKEHAKTAPLYLRMLHEVIAQAIELGCSKISLGRTALEAKAQLGAKPVPMHLWIRHRTPGINSLLGKAVQLVPEKTAPHRNPFKIAK